MSDKKKSIIKGGILITLALLLIYLNVVNWMDSDGWWILATGDWIRANGIMYTNAFVIAENLKIVVQQWLYCVGVSWIYNVFGYLGLAALTALEALTAAWLCYLIGRQHSENRFLCGAVGLITACLMQYTSIRPEWITVILLLIQCLIMEKYLKDRKVWRLYLLPLLTLAEINVHAAYWILHFVLLLPYMVPLAIKDYITNNAIEWRKLKHFIIPLLLMVGVLFINPYGTGAITYLLDSYGEAQKVSISELKYITVFSRFGLIVVSMIVLFAIGIVKKKMTSVSLWMVFGLLILAAAQYKWSNIYTIIGLYACLPFMASWGQRNLEIHTFKIPAMVLGLLCVTLVTLSVYQLQTNPITAATADPAIAYLQENGELSETKVYASFERGNLPEYLGYKVYMDARPELYSKVINGQFDLLDEWLTIWRGENDNGRLTSSDYKAFLDKYDFDYLLLQKGDTYLMDFLTNYSGYQKVILNNSKYYLYVKD